MVTATLNGGAVLTDTNVMLSLGGTAASGTDYSATAPTITITAGDRMGMATLRITPTDDDVVEGNENIEISGTATGGFSGTVTPVTVTLTDNDVASTSIALTVDTSSLSEGDGATDVMVTATLNGGAVLTDTNVMLSLGGTAASGTDYSATAPTITITAGDRMGMATLRITPTDDDVVEGNENIEISGTATGGFSGTVTPVTVTLTDNDVPRPASRSR